MGQHGGAAAASWHGRGTAINTCCVSVIKLWDLVHAGVKGIVETLNVILLPVKGVG